MPGCDGRPLESIASDAASRAVAETLPERLGRRHVALSLVSQEGYLVVPLPSSARTLRLLAGLAAAIVLVSTLSALLSVAVCSPISPFSFTQQQGGSLDDDFVDFDDDAAAGGQGTQHIETGLVLPLQVKWWVCAARDIRMDSYTWLPYAALDGFVVAILTLLPISIGRWLLRRSNLSAESAHHSPFAKLARLQRIGGFFFFLSYAWSSVHRAQDAVKPPTAPACCEQCGGGRGGDTVCCCCRRVGTVACLCRAVGRLLWDPQARPPTDPPARKASITGPPDARLSRATEMVRSEGSHDGGRDAGAEGMWTAGSDLLLSDAWPAQSLNQGDGNMHAAPLLGDTTDPETRSAHRPAAAAAAAAAVTSSASSSAAAGVPLQRDAEPRPASKWQLARLLVGRPGAGRPQPGAAELPPGRRQSQVSASGRQRRSRARKLAASASTSSGGVPLAAEEFSLSLYHALPTGSAWIDRRSLDNGDDISVTTVAGARDACFCILHITPKYVLSPNCVTELLSACERPDPSTIFALVDTSPPLDWSAVDVGGTPWESPITSPSGSSGGWGLAIDLAEALHRAGCRVVTTRAGLISELSAECLRLPHLVPNWRAEAHRNAGRGAAWSAATSAASIGGSGQAHPGQFTEASLRAASSGGGGGGGGTSGGGTGGGAGEAMSRADVAVAVASQPQGLAARPRAPSAGAGGSGPALKSSGLRGLESALVHYWRRAPEDKAPLPRGEMALFPATMQRRRMAAQVALARARPGAAFSAALVGGSAAVSALDAAPSAPRRPAPRGPAGTAGRRPQAGTQLCDTMPALLLCGPLINALTLCCGVQLWTCCLRDASGASPGRADSSSGLPGSACVVRCDDGCNPCLAMVYSPSGGSNSTGCAACGPTRRGNPCCLDWSASVHVGPATLSADTRRSTIACRASALPPVIIVASLLALGFFVISPLLPLHFEKAGMASAAQAARRMPWVVIVLTLLIVVQAARLLSQAFVNFAVGHSQSMIPLLLAAEVDPNLCLFVVRGHDPGAAYDSSSDGSQSDASSLPRAERTGPAGPGSGGPSKPPPLGREFRHFVQSEVGFRTREVTYEQAQRLWMLCIDTMTAPAFSSEQRRIAKFAALRTGGQGLSTWQSPLDLSQPLDMAAQAASRSRGLAAAASGTAASGPPSVAAATSSAGVARAGAARVATHLDSASQGEFPRARAAAANGRRGLVASGPLSPGGTSSSEHDAAGPGLGPSLTAEGSPSTPAGPRAPPLSRAASANSSKTGAGRHRRASSHKSLRATVRAVQFLIGRTKQAARDSPTAAPAPSGRPSSGDHTELSELWMDEGDDSGEADGEADMDSATHDSILSLIAQLCGLSAADLELFEWGTRLRLVAYLRQMQPQEVEQEARDLAVELGLQPDGRAEHEEWKALLFPNCFVFCVETVPDAEAYFHHFMGMVRVCQTLLVNYQTVLAPYAPIASSLTQEQAAAAATKGGAAADSETDVDPLTALRSVLFQDMSSPSIAKDLFARLAAKIGALVHRPRLGAEGLRPWFLSPTVSPVLERVGRQVRLRASVAEQVRSWLVAPLSGVFQWHTDVDAENDPSRRWLDGGEDDL
ncbi:hypothetical protein FNF31_07472 [Cafeteria roenbergensis]|uniref:Uncharacterized protein n=1 Tax=Cafeteria roenbergensis TaxID=33653 RepID=A0A5A8C5N2_CAFRO|nr:hypothetical protein FNF31_07472 [Cafeteria roenbergensis]